MDYKLNSKLVIEESGIRKISARAAELVAAGEKIADLSIGIPMVDPDPLFATTATEAIKLGKVTYPPSAGYPSLRETFSSWHNKNYQTDFKFEETIVTSGGRHAMFMLLQLLLNPGDEVLIIAPYWTQYTTMVEMMEGVSVIVDTKETDDWKVTPEMLKEKLTVKSKVLMINNASNPTGVLYTEKELYEILKFAKENNLIVISDEVYSTLVFDNEKFISAAQFKEFKENVFVVNSASKMFALTGLRVGFLLGDKEVMKKINSIQTQETAGTSSVSQHIVEKALLDSDRIIKNITNEIKNRRDLAIAGFSKKFNTKLKLPKSTIYGFIPISLFGNFSDSTSLSMHLLEKQRVAVVPGVAFGEDNYVRISFGVTHSDIENALKVL